MVLIEDITDKRGGGQQEQQQQQQPSATSTTNPSPSADIAAAAAAPSSSSAADNDEALQEYEDPDVSPPEDDDLLPSDERMLDAHEIEQLVGQMQRPTAKLHVTSLITKLRRESEALQRLEKTHQLQQSPTKPGRKSASAPSGDENKDPASTKAGGVAAAAAAAPVPKAVHPATVLAPPPQPIPVAPPAGGLHAYYVSIDTFAFDAGGYNSPFVTLYVELPRVGSLPRDAITCHFTTSSVDLIVRNLDGKSYRLYKDNLDKDVDPTKCKIIVKSHKVLVKLAKIKSEYGSYDYWTQLTAKKSRTTKAEKKEDPSASIMQLMRDMYEDGDDSMRKVIGETMLKQQRGELGGGTNDPMGGGAMGMGGLKDDDDDEDF
jgi:calcyclin binding protein